jgi:hypothetical protein
MAAKKFLLSHWDSQWKCCDFVIGLLTRPLLFDVQPSLRKTFYYFLLLELHLYTQLSSIVQSMFCSTSLSLDF